MKKWFGTCTDIQEQKELEDQKERLLVSERAARSAAEQANRTKDEFLATLSHELRTPLNAIFGWTHLLQEGHTEPDLVLAGIKVIDRNVRTQAQLIEDLLDMSRIISGKLRVDVQDVFPVTCIEAAVETVSAAANAKEIRLQQILDPLAGPVSGDPGRIQQIIWNLLSNAIKFTRKGGRVDVLLQRVNSHLEIIVSDSGQGIGADFLPHVFDRFRQADSAITRQHGGLGLGLSIVKQLVELHGGTIRAESDGEGKGATFIVSLPVKAAYQSGSVSERHHPTRLGASGPGLPHSQLEGLRVLIVDDEPDTRDLLCRLLQDRKADVLCAGSAPEALELLRLHRPDVLLSDIGLPGLDGYELLARVRALPREEGRDTPAIALTALARSEDRTRAHAAGFLAHLAKPVEPAELFAAIAVVAGGKKNAAPP